jgi:hypothetical protein
LLELAFVILLHLLLARPALPGPHTNEDTQDKQDQESTSHYEFAEPSCAEEPSQPASGAAEEEDNRGHHQARQSNQAHDTQHRPHQQLPGGQHQTIDFGAHKVCGIRPQFLDLL